MGAGRHRAPRRRSPAWLDERGLLEPGAVSCDGRRLSACPGACASCLRALALANTTRPAAVARREHRRRRGARQRSGSRFAIGAHGEPRLVPVRGRRRPGPRRHSSRSRPTLPRDGQRGRAFKACRKDTLRLDLLRPLAQPLLQLVLDDDLRQPDEDGRLPPPAGDRVRPALYVVGLAWRRVRRRSSGALLAACGIAVGTAVLVGVLAGTKIAQDRSVSQAVERIPAASRSVRAVWFGVPVGAAQAYPAARRDRPHGARRSRPPRPDADRPLPREHRRRALRLARRRRGPRAATSG